MHDDIALWNGNIYLYATTVPTSNTRGPHTYAIRGTRVDLHPIRFNQYRPRVDLLYWYWRTYPGNVFCCVRYVIGTDGVVGRHGGHGGRGGVS